jgi:hypothetical protein
MAVAVVLNPLEGDKEYISEYTLIALHVADVCVVVLQIADMLYLFQELLREGLVGTLVHKITEFVKENGKAHSKSSVRLKTQKDSIKDNSCDDNVDIASSSSSRHLPPVLRYICYDNRNLAVGKVLN